MRITLVARMAALFVLLGCAQAICLAQTVIAATAVPASDFLNSIGVVSTFPDRGQPLPKTIEMVKYAGFRWVRGGIEGLTPQGPTTLQTYLDLHQQTGVRFSWGLGSGGSDLGRLIETYRPLAAADALLAFEGNNEPNNWGVTYQGEQGGGRASSWLAVAKLQRDLYAVVKRDPLLKKYPVWSISEGDAEVDNVGSPFLTIPEGAGTLLPGGTKYADQANVHNYVYHPASPGLDDSKTNLTTILADRGSLARPGQLNYSIPAQPATVHEMLLQKSDGTFELLIWGERLKGADAVTVNLRGAYPAVNVYDPTIGTEPIETSRCVDSLKLTLSDHPLIIAIARAAD